MPRRSAFFFDFAATALAFAALIFTFSSTTVAQPSVPASGQGKPFDISGAVKPPAPVDSDPAAPHLKPADLDKRPQLTDGTKMRLIQVIEAEFVHARKYFRWATRASSLLLMERSNRVMRACTK